MNDCVWNYIGMCEEQKCKCDNYISKIAEKGEKIRKLKEEIEFLEQRLKEAATYLSNQVVCPDSDASDSCDGSCYECWWEYLNRET